MSKSTDILQAYLYNQSCFMLHELEQLQENVRYRQLSDVDCFELIIAITRYNTFMEVSRDVKSILGINHKSPVIKKTNKNKE